MIKPKAIQPNAQLQRLADRINARLRDGAKINFFHWEWPAGRQMQTGVQFSFMGNTKTDTVDKPPGDTDVDKLVRQFNAWIESVPRPDKWTTDQAEADSLDWNR
jgi:hypothetical protein